MTKDQKRLAKNASMRKWYASISPELKQRMRNRINRWQRANRDRQRSHRNAYAAVMRAIMEYRIIRPAHCSKCLVKRKVEAHHHNGYAKKYYLDVIWLCKECHNKEHHG